MTEAELAELFAGASARIEHGQPLATQVTAVQLLLGAVREDPRYTLQARDFLTAQVALGVHPEHLVTEITKALAQLPEPR
ncbi:hypothetical protein ED92_10575 [Amycolatopsis sp. MJM2582]|uniref:hypothetical protein n=1 Tax=Amycolatopsis sp. MJM2582 TaxID=1427749 RepID=UPI000503505B|nr:hypothetical protein [Amycolatopsis sp. MJM2582]KFZ80780.1 hypothetical protein ED92_10575 [Amycolatopsis sp. MJM2582]